MKYSYTLLSKVYHGFEDLYDMQRDVSECTDPDLSDCKNIMDIPDEFSGNVLITVTYIPSSEDMKLIRNKD